MSTATNPGTRSERTDQNKQPRRSLQSGFSLLARAEPQIWFTGGMLAVCLAMVVSLLTLILASGLPTFWPQPIDFLALRDGTLDAGEAKARAVAEPFQASPASMDSSEELQGTSYYYRTENFDLTNTHYRWFKPNDLLPAGVVRIPSATLIERFEWGHLYGIPLRIQEPIGPSAVDQTKIDAIARVVDALKSLSQLQDSPTETTESEAAALARALQSIEQLYGKTKSDAIQRSIKDASTQEVQFRLVGEVTWRPQKELDANAIAEIEAARSIIVDSDSVNTRIASLIPVVSAQRKRIEQLKRAMSRLDVRISQLRIAVRQAELDTSSVLPIQLDGAHNLLEQLAILKQVAERIGDAKNDLPSLLNNAEISDPLQRLIIDFEQNRLPPKRAAFEQQLNDWRKPLDSSPQALREAVADYERGYREVLAEKQPIQQQINTLQEALDRGELIVCVPNSARRLDDVTKADISQTASGKIAGTVIDRFKAMEIDIDETATKVLFAGDALSLVTIKDSRASNHILSASDSLNLLAEHPVAFKELVRVVRANELTFGGKVSVYFSRWAEFLFEDPREANTLGGVFPAIWGTIVMTLIMTMAVVPFGVMAALYLREYTNGGPLVSIIRISINNLAGVPSIVYGVFGFSFFCMTIGSFVDGGPKGADITVWPSGTWYLVLWTTVAIGTTAFMFSFFSSGPVHSQTILKRGLARAALVLWLICLIAAITLVAKSPFFGGFYEAQLPNPTFGKGGLLWASLTLALLTLPVVIVATEEALAAVPNSLREGSLACGASKWQTIRRIVLPHARPGILTGAILAMARGAGEVAPLMLVGALPNAPELPMDSEFPFFHGSRNFMHLGYQIYSLGFQSQNSEAAKPMVFTCTLLLILIVAALNIVAIFLRTRLRRRFQGNQF
jgi:ABC-type phosphate transport system permease subunit